MIQTTVTTSPVVTLDFRRPTKQSINFCESAILPPLYSSDSNEDIGRESKSHRGIPSKVTSDPYVEDTQNALVVTAERKYQVIPNFPVPRDLAPHEVLIRTHAVGLNHIDWKSVDYNFCLPAFPWITGREMAGVVERIGEAVRNVQVGQRVWTKPGTYYRDRRAGCFQDLVVVPEHTVFHIPSGLDFNAAACLGVPAITAAMTLWRWLEVSMSDETSFGVHSLQEDAFGEPRPVMLIWGASTATGQFCLQIAALAGIDTVAVCSEATTSLVESLGATNVVTYTGKTDQHLIGEILSVAQGRLKMAVDVVGVETARVVLEIIKACGSDHVVDFAPLGFMSKDQVLPINARLRDVQMKEFILDPTARVYGERLNELLTAGKLRIPMVKVLEGGVWAIEKGLEMVKKGSLGGQKLVVSFA